MSCLKLLNTRAEQGECGAGVWSAPGVGYRSTLSIEN